MMNVLEVLTSSMGSATLSKMTYNEINFTSHKARHCESEDVYNDTVPALMRFTAWNNNLDARQNDKYTMIETIPKVIKTTWEKRLMQPVKLDAPREKLLEKTKLKLSLKKRESRNRWNLLNTYCIRGISHVLYSQSSNNVVSFTFVLLQHWWDTTGT